jgi:energy-coupling factor transporter ATP-binding protein EcfA2
MSEFDFQPYLSAIALHYAKDDQFYTPTDALLPLEVRAVERQEKADQEKRVEQFPVLEGLRRYALGERREHVLLAGRPGSGKSTALRQLVVALAEAPQPPILGEHELDNIVQSPQYWGFGGQIPVLVQLKADRTVPELIKAEFRARAKVRVTDEQIEDWLLADRLVLLLDGVNEIPNDDLLQRLQEFREAFPQTPMIFTTRDLSLGGDLGIGKRLEMKPLSEPQMREFVGKRLGDKGERLLGQLRDRLPEIAETPLLLKMLCDVFDPETGEIPQSKGELFQWFDRDYEQIKQGIEYVPVSENFWLFKSQILQYLAFATLQANPKKPTEAWYSFPRDRAIEILESWLRGRGMTDAPTKAALWVKDLVNYHLLQESNEPDKIEFHHQLFQEYYAAEVLLRMFEDSDSAVCDRERFQEDYLNYLKWTEVVAIGLSLMEDEKTAVDLVEQSLDVDLMLGARLAGAVHPDFFGKTIEVLSNLNLPKKLYIQCLGATSSNQTVAILEELLNEKDLFLHVVEALRVLGTEQSIQILVNIVFNDLTCGEFICIYIIEALGEIPNRNIVEHLQVIAKEHSISSIRKSATREIEQIQQHSHRTKISVDSPLQDSTKTLLDPNDARAVLNRDLLRRNIDISMKTPDELIDFIDLLIDSPIQI